MDIATFSPESLFQPAMFANPYPVYAELRPHTPLRLEAGGQALYPFMKYRNVYDALRDHETFSSAAIGLVLIGDDEPRHGHLRRLVNKVFTPRRIADAEPWIQAIANELFADMREGEVDVVDQYTMPLPVKVIARLLGIPGEDYRQFKEWSDAFIGQQLAGHQNSVMEMGQYFAKMAALRRKEPGDDLITALVNAEVDGEKLSDMELLGFCVLLLIAGNETTTNLMGNMLNILAGRPDLWARLKADRSLVEPMIEETLRIESPVQFLPRVTTRDVEVDGLTLPKGTQVALYMGAANRDPDAWEDADEFRLDRDLQTHVAFGYGIHFCLGAPLARTEARITLNALLDRYSTIEPGTRPGHRLDVSPIIYGFKELPLTLKP